MHTRESDRSAPAGAERPGVLRLILPVAAAWVLSLGVDLFLHAGLLARLYVVPSPFLLGPEEAFRLKFLGLDGYIPHGDNS